MAVVLCSLFMYLTRNIIIGPPEPRTHARISSAATVSSSHQTLTTLSKIKERNINSFSSTSSSILKTSSRAAVGPAISAPRMSTSYQFPFNFIFFASSSHRANSPSSVVPMKVCSICVINNATRILDCNHSFCSECIESYIRANEIHVHDGIQCPESGCNRIITTQKINMLFPTLLQEIRHKSYQTYGKFKRCCKICKESLVVPPDMIGLQYYHFLQCKNKPCNKSGYYTCYYCNDIVAKGAITFGTHHCVEMEGKMIKNSIGVMERSATRHCPKCFMVIVKNGGCAHMNCSTCGVRFCWDCLRIDHAETNGVCIAPIEISKARKEKATKMAVVIGSPLLLVGAIIATPFYAASKVADRIRNASEARARKKMFNTYNDILSKNAIVFKYRHNPRHLDELDPLILQWAGVNDASILSKGVEIQRVTKDDIHVTLYIGIEGNLEMPGILLPRKLEAQQNLRRTMSLDMLLQAYVVIYQEILKTSIYQYQTRRKKFSSMEGVIANAIASSQQYINSNFPTDQRELLSSVLPWEETIDFFRHHVTANLPDQ